MSTNLSIYLYVMTYLSRRVAQCELEAAVNEGGETGIPRRCEAAGQLSPRPPNPSINLSIYLYVMTYLFELGARGNAEATTGKAKKRSAPQGLVVGRQRQNGKK